MLGVIFFHHFIESANIKIKALGGYFDGISRTNQYCRIFKEYETRTTITQNIYLHIYVMLYTNDDTVQHLMKLKYVKDVKVSPFKYVKRDYSNSNTDKRVFKLLTIEAEASIFQVLIHLLNRRSKVHLLRNQHVI